LALVSNGSKCAGMKGAWLSAKPGTGREPVGADASSDVSVTAELAVVDAVGEVPEAGVVSGEGRRVWYE
jgi:hypothetical protein